jgi:hypothetical protein
MNKIKSKLKTALVVALFGVLAVTQTECKQVKEVLGELSKLFGCTCVCECPEAYRGGGDGDFTGGGIEIRCINPKGGVTDCSTLCALQSIPGALSSNGPLLACFSI